MHAAAIYLVGIAGGTGSGKTRLAQSLRAQLGRDMTGVIEADCYYHNLAHLPPAERCQVNFDHPDAVDVDLMAAHMQELRNGQTVRMHAYNFTTHCRTDTVLTIEPHPIIFVEGILVLACPAVVRLLDLKIYIDENAAVRLQRRIRRDIRERGRTAEMSAIQYTNHVLPMHEHFVEPSRNRADIILRSSDETDRLLPALRKILEQSKKQTAQQHSSALHTTPGSTQ